jgi:hypothetical protein
LSDYILRLLFAALLSATGFGITYLWSHQNRLKISVDDLSPVARVISFSSEVQRRPSKRLIWQDISKNQELYSGEAIRTSNLAEAKIQFLDENVSFALEPDSVVEIERRKSGALNLGFLKGGMIVKSSQENSKVTVNAGDQAIQLGNSEVSISKASLDARSTVEVVRGRPEILKTTLSDTEVQSGAPLKILSPKPGSTVYVDSGPVNFKFDPLDKKYQISLMDSSKQGKPEKLEIVSGDADKGMLYIKVKPGRKFLQLVASNPADTNDIIKSSVIKLNVRLRAAPVSTEPGEKISFVSVKGKLTRFSWQNPGQLVDQVLEISSSRDLQTNRFEKITGLSQKVDIELANRTGQVYWRVSGRIPDTETILSGQISQFTLRDKKLAPLQAPSLKNPALNAQILVLEAAEKGVQFDWNSVIEATSYEIFVRSFETNSTSAKYSIKKNVGLTQINFTDLMPGKYQWSVRALNEDPTLNSIESEVREINISGTAALEWGDKKTEAKFVYKTVKPYFFVDWGRGPGRAVRWRVRLTSERLPVNEREWHVVSEPSYTFSLNEPGLFDVEAESLNSQGQVIAKTKPRRVNVEQVAALKAPEFLNDIKEVIQGSQTGSVRLNWKPVNEGREYVVLVKDATGTIVREVKTPNVSLEMTRLRTGKYHFSIQAIDQLNRAGASSLERSFTIPEYSDVSAPRLMKVNVK